MASLLPKSYFTMSKCALVVSTLLVAVFCPCVGATLSVSPSDDTYVRKDNTNNYSSNSTLLMRESSSSRRRAFMQFTVDVPRMIESAVLRVYSTSGGYTLTPVSTATGWSEDTLTFATIPALGVDAAAGVYVNAAGWVEFDLTDHITNNGTYSFELASTGNGDTSKSISSKEAAENQPELVIVYSDTNSLPVFSSETINIGGIREGFPFAGSFAAEVFEPDSGDVLTLGKVQGSHEGPGSDWLSIAQDGSVSGTPNEAHVGLNEWSVFADDGSGVVTAKIQIHVLEPTTPNVLYILADDLGYADISANGYAGLEYSTPNIDSIFSGGAHFLAGFVSNSVCAPSRAGLLTGRSGSRFGFETNLPNKAGDRGSLIGLDFNQKTIADVLKVVGYQTYGLGKWHLGENDALFHPNVRGFDHFFGMRGGSRSYTQLTVYDSHDSIEENGVWVEEPYGIYITDFLTDKALDYITEQSNASPGQPWFMYMSYTAPHGPMHAKQSDMGRVTTPTSMSGAYTSGAFVKLLNPDGSTSSKTSYDNDEIRQVYCAMVLSLDDNVGRLLNKLDELGIDDDTIVIFHSDNGGPRIGKNWSRNNPLEGEKGSLWEGGIRVPFAISWPRTISSGQQIGHDSPISALDMMPTLASASGADQVQDIRTDGVDIMPILTGERASLDPRSIYWRRGKTEKVAMRHGDYKYYRNRTKDETYVFNHSNGSGENDGNNLALSDPTLLAELEDQYAQYEATIPDPHWTNNGVPAIITYDLDPALAGQAYTMPLNHSSELSVTWSITSGKPDWLTIDPESGELSGTPEATDPYSQLITLQTDDGTSTSSYMVPLRVSGSNNIDLSDWQSLYGITDNQLASDVDGDGVSELLEYALGGNPGVVDSIVLPSLEVTSSAVTFEHVRRKGAALQYGVKVSENMAEWGPAVVAETSVADRGDGFEEVRFTLDLEDPTDKVFVRLQVSESAD